MPRTITYSLKLDALASDDYYSAVSAFADDWLAEALSSLTNLVAGFCEERIQRGVADRSPESCAFDLLALGVLLRQHGRESARLPVWGESLLRGLLTLQERWPQGESLVKAGRGLIYRLARLLDGKPGRESSLDTLLVWLQATGENTQAERFGEWRAFFRVCGLEQEALERCRCLADDFEVSSRRALGKYTEQVEAFLSGEAFRHRWRYDAALLNRTRLEYHLGMLGNEILNREFRRVFLSSPHKVVILPPCMRAQPESECKAVTTKFGERCAACTPACRIHQVTKLGEKHGFDVFMIPEELRVFGRAGNNGGMGVVGVSCVLTNWTGGWDAERINLPAQGLLLDYVGCKYHWDPKGFPTDINLHRLMQILSLD
jgi:uncharacterized protein